MLQGSCLCGAVRYQAAEVKPDMAHCHCSMCRKFHGAAFGTYGVAPAEQFQWLEGEELLSAWRAENGTVRRFCSRCGSSMTFAASGCTGDVVEFALGTLDTPLRSRPDAHIYTDYKADWWEISDGLKAFPEGRQ